MLTKFHVLLFFGLLAIAQVSYCYGASASDSLTPNQSKNGLYFKFYNPYWLKYLKTSFDYEVAMKISLRKEKNFLKIKGRYVHSDIYSSFSGENYRNGSNYQYLGFSYLRRITFSRAHWLNLDFEVGGIFGTIDRYDHFYTLPDSVLYREGHRTLGIGPTVSLEANFMVGKWGSISLLSCASYHAGILFNSTRSVTDPGIPEVSYSDFGHQPYFQYFQIGVNFFIRIKHENKN